MAILRIFWGIFGEYSAIETKMHFVIDIDYFYDILMTKLSISNEFS